MYVTKFLVTIVFTLFYTLNHIYIVCMFNCRFYCTLCTEPC